MRTKTIKISEENYDWICRLSGELRSSYGRPVSIDETLAYVHKKRKLSDLAGKWKMSDKEEKEFFAGLNKGWKRWKIKSA
jgi:predicted CopG family antitoxin